MKFTDGYWHIKPNMKPSFAVEYVRHSAQSGKLSVLTNSRHIGNRGDVLNCAALAVTLDSPLEGVIRVRIEHHRGVPQRGPHFSLYEQAPEVSITDTADALSIQSGALEARVDKRPNQWGIEFCANGRRVTSSGYRGMAHMQDSTDGRCYMLDSLDLDVGECVYGLGERFTPYLKNGQVIEMWNEDGGTSSEIAYKNVPFFMTNRGYGVLVNHPEDVSFEVQSEKVERAQFSVGGESLEYLLIYGPTPLEVLDKYTQLTGRPALPPAWSFGLWLSTSFTTDYDERTVTSFIQGMKDRDIPLHVFHFDCYWMKRLQWCDLEWDVDAFEDPRAMLSRYHERGLKICVWINPYIAQHSATFEEGLQNGYFVRRADGGVWQTDRWQAGMALVDFTNPEACAWFQRKLKAVLDTGVDCFKTDFGERIPVRGIAYHDGSDPLKMHNYYTFLYNRCVFELLKRERGEGDALVFARSATAGGQQFPVHWGGDCTASYISMAETLRGGLSLMQSGFSFWSHDISGFENTASPDVYKRWCAFGLLSSHSRLHGSSSYRVPWLFDEQACDVLAHFVRLKCALMPYLFQLARNAHLCGAPVMRPMAMQFPNDPACDTLDRQYMLGDSLLVAPVMRADGRVQFYLPDGAWTHLLSGERLIGGKWHELAYDFFSLPLFVPDGAVLPMGSVDDSPEYDYADGVTLHLFNLGEGADVRIEIPSPDGGLKKSFEVAVADGALRVTSPDDAPSRLLLRSMGAAKAGFELHPLGAISGALRGNQSFKL